MSIPALIPAKCHAIPFANDQTLFKSLRTFADYDIDVFVPAVDEEMLKHAIEKLATTKDNGSDAEDAGYCLIN